MAQIKRVVSALAKASVLPWTGQPCFGLYSRGLGDRQVRFTSGHQRKPRGHGRNLRAGEEEGFNGQPPRVVTGSGNIG